jgi:AraC-like DNA-binding protein
MQLLLLNVGYLEMDADWNWQNVYSPFARIYYVTGGEARMHLGGQTHTLTPGRLYLIPPFTLHSSECSGRFSHYYVHFYEKAIHKASVFDTYDFPTERDAGALDLQLHRRLLEINPDRALHQLDPGLYDNLPTFSEYMANNNRMTLHTAMETQGILLLLMAGFMEKAGVKSRHTDVRITKCLDYIHENTDKDISIRQLADIACLTEDHLIRVFRREINATPLKYIHAKKMEKALLLLITTELSIRDIALELSIDNTSYFNRLFKAYMGETPTQYRERHSKR